ncbi:MAG: exodeoxyribonuclease VII large subunit [Planctomycetaceae bacterium]|jgi:exodeoxyribonuclease VII large subunit|nr:exodeoxyribonuclease VII large subunit [Planctomycetaceae bacterium]
MVKTTQKVSGSVKSLFDFDNDNDNENDNDDYKLLQSSTDLSDKILESGTAAGSAEVTLMPETVTELTLRIKGVLEASLSEVWVVGEVSNFSRPKSGHVYFTLKDKGSGISAIIWKSAYSKLRFEIEEGMELVCRGRVEVYPPSGKYQLILNKVEPKGMGGLELAFRQLREKLEKQGLFDLSRKKKIPTFIKCVALITSATGAAVRDFLQVLKRRTELVDVLLVPVQVQGDRAAEEIIEAIKNIHEIAAIKQIDCIVIARGGGSAEDLWTFNEESVVRAVANSKIPIISGIGHEIDITLCDLAADIKALTPSEAAERVAVKDSELMDKLIQAKNIIERNIERKITAYKNHLEFLGKHTAIVKPQRIIECRINLINQINARLNKSLERNVEIWQQRFQNIVTTVEALNPLATLARGYSITENDCGKTIRSINEVKPKEKIRTRLRDGQIESCIVSIG